MRKRVLVVDDHPAVALALKLYFKRDGRYVVAASAATAGEGLQLLPGDYDAVLLDLHLPDQSGVRARAGVSRASRERAADPVLGV